MMLTPQDLTEIIKIAKHCLKDPEILDKISFEMNIDSQELSSLCDKIAQYLDN